MSRCLRLTSFLISFGNFLSPSHPLKLSTCKLCSLVIQRGSISIFEFRDKSRYLNCFILRMEFGTVSIP
uniref:Leucine-rich repeat containing protein n=1 Tax=Rhizophora mucronata TaxID=61149 RepID=A0A2P2QG99_RHIMU